MKTLFRAALIAGLALSAMTAEALTTTTTFQVTATINKSCLINSASNVAFGTYDPLFGSALTASGSVVFRCTKGTTYTVDLSTGASGSFAARTMTNGTDTMSYNLYTTAGLVTVFGDGTAGTGHDTGSSGSGIANIVANQKTVSYFGNLPAGQDRSTGAYSDTITVTITY